MTRKRIGIFTDILMTPSGSSRMGCLVAEFLSDRYEVWLISRDSADRTVLKEYFGTPLADVSFLGLDASTAKKGGTFRVLRQLLPAHIANIIGQFPAYRQLMRLRLDLFIQDTNLHYLRAPAPKAMMLCMFPRPLPTYPKARWCHWPIVKPLISRLLKNTLNRNPRAIESFQVIAAVSQFTADHVRKEWQRDAVVVYAPSALLPALPGVTREQIILVVGRYNWDKQQDILLQAFREMPDVHALGWSLHFVGSVHESSRPYLEKLVSDARGLPVVFHYDATLAELHTLYSRSSIYWHAKGYDVPDDQPQDMEHFGCSPVEAMSAGCIPVVFDGGGLRETVDHGKNGFRWRTIRDLQEATRCLVNDEQMRRRLREQAARIDERFMPEMFLAQTGAIVNKLVPGDGENVVDP